MDDLWLTNEQAEQIIDHAIQDAPHEACGILAGKGNRVIKVIRTKNTASDPKRRFEIDRYALAQLLPQLERDGFDLLGFYHSHPNGDTIPSQTDIREATHPNITQLIVGLKRAQPQLGVWKISGLRVESDQATYWRFTTTLYSTTETHNYTKKCYYYHCNRCSNCNGYGVNYPFARGTTNSRAIGQYIYVYFNHFRNHNWLNRRCNRKRAGGRFAITTLTTNPTLCSV